MSIFGPDWPISMIFSLNSVFSTTLLAESNSGQYIHTIRIQGHLHLLSLSNCGYSVKKTVFVTSYSEGPITQGIFQRGCTRAVIECAAIGYSSNTIKMLPSWFDLFSIKSQLLSGMILDSLSKGRGFNSQFSQIFLFFVFFLLSYCFVINAKLLNLIKY